VTIAAAALAVLAACCYAVAATLQHNAVEREPRTRTLDPRLLFRLLRRPQWMGGVAADAVGTGLHGTALALGPLALVQPLLVSGLIVAVPLEAAMHSRRPMRRDLVGVVLAGIGLGTFVSVADPRPGDVEPVEADLRWVVLGAGLIIAALVTISRRVPGDGRATMLGIATGAGYALSASLAKACVDEATTAGWALLYDWRLFALIIAGGCSVVLNQNAYQAGGLAGPLTGIVLTDPLGSVVIAVVAYNEVIRHSPLALAVEAVALVVMSIGVWLVSSRQNAAAPRGPTHRC
jgi:hypothetical protein